MPKTLKDYIRHNEDCRSLYCVCGFKMTHEGDRSPFGNHDWQPAACTCGLDALLQSSEGPHETTDHGASLLPADPILNLQVILVNECGMWVAQALEFDYAAGGETKADVKQRFEQGLRETIQQHFKMFGNLDKLLTTKPAPEYTLDLLNNPKLVHKYSCVSKHSFTPPASTGAADVTFPYGQISYVEPVTSISEASGRYAQERERKNTHPQTVAEGRETPDLHWEKTRLKDVIWALLIQVYGGRLLNSLVDTDVPEAIDALITAALAHGRKPPE
jgi:hypothetical protein